MTIEQLLQQLKANNIHLELQGDSQLRLRASKGTLTPELQAIIKQHKPALIAWLQQQQAFAAQHTAITHQVQQGNTPLSLQQQRLWLSCQTAAGNTAYQIPAAILISGDLHVERFADAVNRVIAHHPLLHCVVQEQLGKPVHSVGNCPQLEIADSAIAANDIAKITHYATTWLGQPIDPAQGPLLRLQLLRLQTTEQPSFLLLMNIHHLLTDGWSNRLLVQQIIAEYTGNASNDINENTVDYFDYVRWQEQQLQHGQLAQQREFWQQHLSGIEALMLPTQHCQKQANSHEAGDSGTQVFTVDMAPHTLKTLYLHSQQWQVSSFAMFLAAYQLTLYKLSYTPVFGILSPFANRQHDEILDTIGFFVNLLPLKADFSAPLHLQALVQHCHQTVQQINNVSEVPFAAISESLHLHNANDVNRFFPAAISHDADILFEQVSFEGINFEALPLPAGSAKFPLLLTISERNTTTARLEYDSAIYSADFIQRFSIYFRRALHAVVFNPQQTVNEFSLLTEAEQLSLLGIGNLRSQYALVNLIGDSNRTATALPVAASVHEIFQQQVQLTPDAIAVSDDNHSLTYAELAQQASRLAQYLSTHYAASTTESPVIGICLERSVNVSVTLLGILQAGFAYMPLDPQLPTERLRFMLDESHAVCVISHSAFAHLFDGLVPCVMIDNTALWQPTTPATSTPATSTPEISHLFNLIYTSGSTGTPKGVRVLQRGIINRLLWMQAQYPLDIGDVVLQKTPLSFDVSVWELFWPLLNGARLHFARPDGHRDTAYLHDVIRQQQVSTLHFVPSMLDLFLDNIEPEKNASLKRVFCSGEALLGSHVSRFRQYLPDTELHNLYGPTEASVDVSYHDCATTANSGSVPIGKPIWNTQLHIFDSTLRPVAPGSLGEIVIGGIGLAEGYQDNAALSAECFIDNPFYIDGHPSPRLYKTGDLGRHLADGSIEFLGRNDRQIKLRGLRIEPGDIEHHALHYPGIPQAAAMITGAHGDAQLTLFYTASEAITTAQWREFLLQHLPAYMLPNYFIYVQHWPFTLSGKTDRKVLLAMQQPLSALVYSPAENATQQCIQQVWEQHFHKPIDINENFFEAGGHSLLAMRIIAELAGHFQVNLQFRDIFSHDSIAELASHINTLPQANTFAIKPAPAAAVYPASFQQQRLYLFQALYPQSTVYNMPVAFALHGKLDIAALQQSLHTLIQRHAVLHTVYDSDNQTVWQKPLPHYEWQLDIIDAASRTGDKQLLAQHYAQQHAQQAFNLHLDLPIRAALYMMANEHYLFCLCLHHIAGDAATLAMIARELASAYNAFTAQQLPVLPALPLQYHDFSVWQRQQDMHSQLDFWQTTLGDAPELLALPHDRPRGVQQSWEGAQYQQELDKTLVENLLHFSTQQQLTPFMVLLSTLQLLLGKLAQQDDVCVGIPVAGRNHHALQNLAGFFVNSIILRSRQHDNPGFGEFLQQQKNHLLASFAHQDIPLEQVLEHLAQQRPLLRSTRHTPIAQIGCNFLQDTGTEQMALSLPGLAITPLQTDVSTSKYEMTWIFYQHSNGIRLSIEYNTGLFFATTVQQWAGYFIHLLNAALAAPQTPLQQLRCIDEAEIRTLLEQRHAPVEKCYPLTATQRDIYLDSLIFPDKRHNQLGFLTHSTTALNMALWRTVLQDLYTQTDSLRARIVRTQHPLLDIAWQVIPPAAELPAACFRFFDHQNTVLTDTAKHDAAETALFSPWPETEPLWRVHIHQFAGHNYLFILAAHHAMFDGVSIQMLGRMIKGNYQRAVQGEIPEYPANNYADYVQQHNQQADTSATYHFWQKQAAALQPYINLRPLLNRQPDSFASVETTFTNADWQQLQALCKNLRTTAPLFFKAVFALAIKAWHRMDGNFCFTEVVLGRERKFHTTQGLFFEQQPNIIEKAMYDDNATLEGFLAALRQYRKQIAPFTPISLRLQQQLLPSAIPYLFNFYIMESATPFFGKMEHIEHLMPEMDHAVNCIVKVIDEQLSIQLMYNRSELQGEAFLAAISHIIQRCLQGDTLLAQLLPDVPAWQASRFSMVNPLPAAIAETTSTEPAAKPLPHTETRRTANSLEQQIIAIWQEVLGKHTIGPDDNFFELGGHSLHAMRIANRLREQFNVDIPLDALFRQPTVAAIALYLQTRPPQATTALPPLQAVANHEHYPLSPAQQRLWFLTQLDTANAAYNIAAALQLHGTLNRPTLLQAIATLIERQQVLRSVIDNSSDLPQWRLLPASSLHIDEITVAADISKQQLNTIIKAEATKPFATSSEALVRISLLTVDDKKHLLLLTLHHLIADAASLLLIARELGIFYHAFNRNQANPLLPLPVQYADYAHWQQQLLNTGIIQQQLDYWREELAQAPELLGLPLDYPRPALQTFNGAALSFALPAGLAAKLRSLAQANGVTTFMLLLASYQLLLSRLCHQHDVCVGIPRDGRVLHELEPLAGFFINALVIRTRFDADYDIDELLGKVRDKTLAAFANDLVPAEQVMQALQLQRQLQFTPIVQAAFNYLSIPEQMPATEIDGLHISLLPAPVTTAKFELLLTVTDSAETLQASLEYNRDLFNEGTIATIRYHWLYLLETIAGNPAARISQLHLPGMARHNEITRLHSPALPPLDFMHAITQQASAQPHAIAAICGKHQLNYKNLENNANVVAQLLLHMGIKPGDRVGICLPCRLELLPAILGTIKAGACYVPLDVHYPAERLAYMLDDSAATVVISEYAVLATLPKTNAVIIDIDAIDFSITAAAPAITANADDLFYLIYTSGSTGLPKGTAVYRRNVANLLAWHTQEFGFSAQDKTLVMSSTGFDLTQKNLFAPLITGGTLVLADNTHYDVFALLQCISNNRISVLNCAPSAFYPLLETADEKGAEALQSLRCLLLGGEVIQLKRLAHWITAEHFHCSITNMYGPTECTDISAFHTLQASELKGMIQNDHWQFPLGKPSAGVSLYVLNESLQTVPNGLTGELCISGHNVGAGYWQQPELSAAAFVSNPFADNLHKQEHENEQTLYLSGDRVRLNPDDGLLYFIGRADFQLKLRGLRIEAGEIEQVLRELPDIFDSVVMVENEQLMAFVLAKTSPQPANHHWRTALQQRLPAWMIPTLILPLTAWPLTSHGKIDRQALLALPRPENPVLYMAPRTALEEAIAEEWQHILGISRVGIFDNFFEVGGNSLAAVRLVSALEQRFTTQLPVAALFGAQTIAQQAMLVENPRPEWSPVITLQAHGNQTPIFALPSLGAVAHSYTSLAKALGPQQPFYALQAYGFEDGQTPFTDLGNLLEFYTRAIQQQQPHGPYQLIGHSFGGILAIELARQLLAQGECVKFIGLFDSYLPLRYRFNDMSDAQILQTLDTYTDNALTESLSRRLIAIVRGIQQMMESFTVQPLGNTPLLLFTPEDISAKAFGVALNLSQLRNVKTRGFEKVSSQVKVITVTGNHLSLLNVDNSGALVQVLQEVMAAE